jgi:hypothetical protein
VQIHLSMRSIYITPESGKRRTTTRHRRFLLHPSIHAIAPSVPCSLLAPSAVFSSVPRSRRTYMKISSRRIQFTESPNQKPPRFAGLLCVSTRRPVLSFSNLTPAVASCLSYHIPFVLARPSVPANILKALILFKGANSGRKSSRGHIPHLDTSYRRKRESVFEVRPCGRYPLALNGRSNVFLRFAHYHFSGRAESNGTILK